MSRSESYRTGQAQPPRSRTPSVPAPQPSPRGGGFAAACPPLPVHVLGYREPAFFVGRLLRGVPLAPSTEFLGPVHHLRGHRAGDGRPQLLKPDADLVGSLGPVLKQSQGLRGFRDLEREDREASSLTAGGAAVLGSDKGYLSGVRTGGRAQESKCPWRCRGHQGAPSGARESTSRSSAPPSAPAGPGETLSRSPAVVRCPGRTSLRPHLLSSA
jgi:hypothetical protein